MATISNYSKPNLPDEMSRLGGFRREDICQGVTKEIEGKQEARNDPAWEQQKMRMFVHGAYAGRLEDHGAEARIRAA